MSLSLALSSAMSGLSLSARGTQIVSENIANAQTDGYGVRSLTQASRSLGMSGNGVMITGVSRHVDYAILAELRNAASQRDHNAVLGSFWQRFEAGFGVPGEAGSLSQNLALLGTALQRASFTPDQPAVLQQVTRAASDVARTLSGLNASLQQERDDADASIAREIAAINQSLESIAGLNGQIQRQTLMGGSPEALIDARQRLVDEVSARIPVREYAREDGRIMLMAEDGSILVDREAARFEFTRSTQPLAGDRIENGGVSAVSLNGHDILPGSAMFKSGRIGALLQIRDVAAPEAQDHLDLIVSDLIHRFADPSVDPTLAPEQFGLFSLRGLSTVPGSFTGLAGQLIVNPIIDPAAGGETWRLRAGFNAPAPGDALDNSFLDRMAQALETARPLAGVAGQQRSAFLHASDFLSGTATARFDLEQRGAQTLARHAALSEVFAAQGVDIDAELSKLLVLELAYSANARVLSTVDAMMRTILEI